MRFSDIIRWVRTNIGILTYLIIFCRPQHLLSNLPRLCDFDHVLRNKFTQIK